MNIKNITCIGAGFVESYHVSNCSECPFLQINVVDINEEKIKNWNDCDLSKLPVYEPGLDNIIKSVEEKSFSLQI